MPIKVTGEVAKKFPRFRGVTSTPLDWDALYRMSESLTSGTVLIDEAQYFSDSRSSSSLKNRLLNAIVAQVRKRNLNLYYTVKVGDWVDKRLSYETDLHIDHFDLALASWGKEHRIERGTQIRVRYRDLSGVFTGTPYEQSQRVFSAKIFHGRKYWDCYDTSQVIDLEEAFTGVKLDLKQRVISNKRSSGDVIGNLHNLASMLKERRGNEVSTAEYWNLAEMMGVEGGSRLLGRYLSELGVIRKQKHGGSYYYDLTNLQDNPLNQVEGA